MDKGTPQSEPLYIRVVEEIKKQILDGTLAYGDRLPTDKGLCAAYKVSRTTLRKAVDTLALQGMVERRANKGIYVSYSRVDTAFERPTSIFQRMAQSGIRPTSKILAFNHMPADSRLAGIFGIPEGELLLQIHRIRYADGVPFSEQTMYLKERAFPGFNPWALSEASFHSILRQEYGYQIERSTQTVFAAAASKSQEAWLKVKYKQPLLHTKSVLYITAGEAVEYQESYMVTSVVPYSFAFMGA